MRRWAAIVLIGLVACGNAPNPTSGLEPAENEGPCGGTFTAAQCRSAERAVDKIRREQRTEGGKKDRERPEPAPEPQPDRDGSIPRVAYKLAVIDEDGYIDRNDPVVDQFAAALKVLTRKCPDPAIRLADMTVASQRELARNLVTESLLSIITSVGKVALAGPVFEASCADLFVAYVTLRS